MFKSISRRDVLKAGASAGTVLGLGDLGFLSRLSAVSAAEAKLAPNTVRLQPGIEPLVRLLRRCLEKDPKRRLRDIGDARAELEAAAAPDAGRLAPTLHVVVTPRRIPGWMMGAGVALALAAGVAMGRWLLVPARTTPTPVRFEISLPNGARGVMAPDGLKVALTTPGGLQIRDLDRLETRIGRGRQRR